MRMQKENFEKWMLQYNNEDLEGRHCRRIHALLKVVSDTTRFGEIIQIGDLETGHWCSQFFSEKELNLEKEEGVLRIPEGGILEVWVREAVECLQRTNWLNFASFDEVQKYAMHFSCIFDDYSGSNIAELEKALSHPECNQLVHDVLSKLIEHLKLSS